MEKTDYLTTKQAANNLALKVRGTEWGYWLNFLVNGRKQARKSSRSIPFHREGRQVLYRLRDLHEFAVAENARRASAAAAPDQPAPGRSHGATKGFKWSVDGRSDAAGASVRLKVSGITIGLTLTPQQARDLAQELKRHADRFST